MTVVLRDSEPKIIPQPAFVELRAGVDGKLYGRTADGRWFVYSEQIQRESITQEDSAIIGMSNDS